MSNEIKQKSNKRNRERLRSKCRFSPGGTTRLAIQKSCEVHGPEPRLSLLLIPWPQFEFFDDPSRHPPADCRLLLHHRRVICYF